MKKILITEGLDFRDMENQIVPEITVDEYSAKMGSDSDIVTLSFIVKSDMVGDDLVNWFERGYDWILDASLSDGEIETNRWLVFVELSRRSTVPGRIVELLKDLKTLTNLKLNQWKIVVDDEEYTADESILKSVIICNPNEYKIKKEKANELNEMREIAGIDTKAIYQQEKDAELRDFMSKAGL